MYLYICCVPFPKMPVRKSLKARTHRTKPTAKATPATSIVLNKRQQCDLELLLNGSFYPVTTFMDETDYTSCVHNLMVQHNQFWPMPITLAINDSTKRALSGNPLLILTDDTGLRLASVKVTSIFTFDVAVECSKVLGTTDANHPYVRYMKEQYAQGFQYYVSGPLQKINPVPHYDFQDYRLTPPQLKQFFKTHGWKKIVGFQTRNPMHRCHYELTKYALRTVGAGAHLLLNPVVGETQPGDIDHYARVKCYKHIMKYYKEGTAKLSLLPLSMRMAGPREALFHACIRRNLGCTHFIIGRDHAGPSAKNAKGESFYGPYEAHQLALKYETQMNIKIILSEMIVYATNKATNRSSYRRLNTLDKSKYTVQHISGTQQRKLLRANVPIPTWFSFKPVADELQRSIVPYKEQGICLYFVGLSGSGKSTLANSLMESLKECTTKRVFTLLDGDVVRKNLSSGLTFSKADRQTNVRRIGWVASQIVRNNGICVVANIAPYKEDRLYNRNLISENGHYIQIWVDTPLSTCKKRDVKGLYDLAERGIIKQFTGVSDPFETPIDSDIRLKGTQSIASNIAIIKKKLQTMDLID